MAEKPEEPYLDFVPSITQNQSRLRFLFGAFHPRPLGETFHDFLVQLLKWTFTETWWKHQAALSPDKQHVVFRWEQCRARLREQPAERLEADGTGSRRVSGQVASLLQLGYDLYCLQVRNRLPQVLVDKLLNHQEFQGARYELIAGAIMQRAGFRVEFLDDSKFTVKHSEFIATDRLTGVRVGVEAKSRKRPGVLNAPAGPQGNDVRGMQGLLRKAKKQGQPDLPFFAFLDVNLPSSPGVRPAKWTKDLQEALSTRCSAAAPDPFTAIFATNFAGHYGAEDEKSLTHEWVTVIPRHCTVAVEPPVLFRIDDVMPRYVRIPINL